MNTTTMENIQSRQNFFQNAITRMANYWNNSEAVKAIQVSTLDKERETILKAITLAMDVNATWPVTKNLIITFTPYMERRGHWEVWHDLLVTAIDKAQSLGDFDGAITLTALLARLCLRQSRHQESVQLSRKVIQLAKKSGNKFEEARACSNLGYYFIDKGHWWRSEVLCCHALKIFEELESTHGLAHTHNHLGGLFERKKDIKRAEEHLQLAGGLFNKLGDESLLSMIYGNLGNLYLEDESRFDEAEYYLSNAIEKAELAGERANLGRLYMNLAIAHINSNYFDTALEYLKKAEKINTTYSNTFRLGLTWQNMGELFFKQSNYIEGRTYLRKAIDFFYQEKSGYNLATTLSILIKSSLEHQLNVSNEIKEFDSVIKKYGLSNYPEFKATYKKIAEANN